MASVNERQRWILQLYAAILVAMLLFPPTHISTTNSTPSMTGLEYTTHAEDGGFQFIGNLGTKTGPYIEWTTSIAPVTLLVEILAATLAAAAVWIAASKG